MAVKEEDLRRSWLLLVPLTFVISSILSVYYSDGLTFLWAVGSLSVAGCMVLVLLDATLGRRPCKILFLFQALLLLLSAFMPEFSSGTMLSPRLIVFSVGTSVAMCVSLFVNLYYKSLDADFLLGEYRGRDFLADAMRVVYALLLNTVLMAVAETYWASSLIRISVGILAVVLALFFFTIISMRFYAMYTIERTLNAEGVPSESDTQLYRQIIELMDNSKPFLDPSLNVDEICKQLGTNRSYISRCINACTGFSVPRFINNRRVLYAMELYQGNMSLKVSELAVLSGFSNGVTFNTAFRLETNMSPRDWCRERRDEAAKERKRLSKLMEQEQEE